MFKYLLSIAVLFVTACSSTGPEDASTKKHKDGKGRERKDPTSFRFIIQLTSLRMFLSFITNWYTIYNEILRLNYSFLPFCKDRI